MDNPLVPEQHDAGRPEGRTTERSFAPLTHGHLHRLAVLAQADHESFSRPGGRPEYRARRRLVALAQGAALHFLDGVNGVKDLDVWTFYAAVRGARFPADRRETHADFGASELGRQQYRFEDARGEWELARWRRWADFAGRRVDFMMRALAAPTGDSIDEIVDALRDWLAAGSLLTSAKKPTAWHLAQKAVVLVWPEDQLGRVVWPNNGDVLTVGRPRPNG